MTIQIALPPIRPCPRRRRSNSSASLASCPFPGSSSRIDTVSCIISSAMTGEAPVAKSAWKLLFHRFVGWTGTPARSCRFATVVGCIQDPGDADIYAVQVLSVLGLFTASRSNPMSFPDFIVSIVLKCAFWFLLRLTDLISATAA